MRFVIFSVIFLILSVSCLVGFRFYQSYQNNFLSIDKSELLKFVQKINPEVKSVNLTILESPQSSNAYEKINHNTGDLLAQISVGLVGSESTISMYLTQDYTSRLKKDQQVLGTDLNTFIVSAISHALTREQESVDCSEETWCNYDNAKVVIVH